MLFNQGTLIINYIGHGNERVWAHEAILTREETLPQLTNHDKLTFVMAATCSFARWDNSLELSGGEQILTMEQGGAIAVVASVRGVYSTDNFVLNYDYFSNLFQRDSIGLPPRIGDAMRLTKLTHTI